MFNFEQQTMSTNWTGTSPMSSDNPPIDDLMVIIRVQSLVRGFLQRRQYRIQKLYSEGASKYFKTEEA